MQISTLTSSSLQANLFFSFLLLFFSLLFLLFLSLLLFPLFAKLIAEALQQGHSVVALGDINDFDGTVTDASGNIPISQVLSLLRDPLPTPGDGK